MNDPYFVFKIWKISHAILCTSLALVEYDRDRQNFEMPVSAEIRAFWPALGPALWKPRNVHKFFSSRRPDSHLPGIRLLMWPVLKVTSQTRCHKLLAIVWDYLIHRDIYGYTIWNCVSTDYIRILYLRVGVSVVVLFAKFLQVLNSGLFVS